ncbi:hypothetical protein JXA84_05225, partial [candidate division WOR-3 bacterium]|nr:hypothetical protein [candidate division WOR-3 bacterium]
MMKKFAVLASAMLLIASAVFADNLSRAGNPDPENLPLLNGPVYREGSRDAEVLFVEAPGQTGFG